MPKSWKSRLKNRLTKVNWLQPYFGTHIQDSAVAGMNNNQNPLPFAATWEFLSRSTPNARGVYDLKDPILAQVIPQISELEQGSNELSDPLYECEQSLSPRIIQHYPSRILIRVIGQCALYCRFCYRRNLLQQEKNFLSSAELEKIGNVLSSHTGIREVLVSGGDPLFCSNSQLQKLFAIIRINSPQALIRVCTRIPIVLPSRMDKSLIKLLQKYKPLRLILHINHPQELDAQVQKTLQILANEGLGLRSQTVLLQGINNRPNILIKLFSWLPRLGVDPYYLFQCDRAIGNKSFRTPFSESLQLYDTLRQELSGLELPRFALDLPGGKVFLPDAIIKRQEKFWLLRKRDGQVYPYPESD